MLEERLAELEERLRTAPGDLDLLAGVCVVAAQMGRLPESLTRERHLGPLCELWRRRPEDRSLIHVVLPLLGLEQVTDERRRPGVWWSQERRLAESERGAHFHDPVSGWPLVVRRRRDGAVMVYVPAGPFEAGDDCDHSVLPRREEQTGAYLIDRYPVTVEAFRAFLRETAAEHPQYHRQRDPFRQPRHPASFTSFGDAEAHGEWEGARLPTALEWEKAARGTDGRRFPWGDEGPDRTRANYYWDEGANDAFGFMDHRPEPVDLHPAGESPFGLLDMAGNVWEWCRDEVPADAGGEVRLLWDSGAPQEGRRYLVRGGCYQDFSASDLAAAGGRPARAAPAAMRSRMLGFRLVVPLF